MKPPGSNDRPSLPPTTKLLVLPPPNLAAHDCCKSEVACSTAPGDWARLPLTSVIDARIVPGMLFCEDAVRRSTLKRIQQSKFKSVAISSTCLDLSTLFRQKLPTKAAYPP